MGETAGAKLLLVGDPAQLRAVGPGGALEDVAARGVRYELAEVRRFVHEWERTASLQLRAGDPAALADYAKRGRLRDGGTAEQTEAAAARAWLADTLAGKESLLMVRDNRSAARLSASLRAELVRLGRVDARGVALGHEGWEGVVAGVGDLVQARRNGWELIGVDGNTAAPINRDNYRVTGLRPDGGLTVARVVERGSDGEVLGEPLALPARYVAQDVTLAYASTAHAAEGRTVDTGHSVLGAGTDAAGLLVPMTRGRECNTAWVVTTALAPDAETGETFDVEARAAAAVLADVLDAAERERSALAEREQADLDTRSTCVIVDRLVDVVGRVVTAGRTASTLDRLTAEGTITPAQRQQIAADSAYGSLERLLRTAELCGHDADAVLAHAIAYRSLDSARSPAQVVHSRITDRWIGRLTPHVSQMADLIPRDAPSEWAGWLQDRAEAADLRRHELGAEIAEQAPAWATEALGPVPEDVFERQDWEQRAGWAAAYRELVGHDDEHDPLGHAPAAGQPEKAALFRAAHEALGLLDVGAEEADLTEGQLRVRVAAMQREENWAPAHVADQLDATHQEAAKARVDAQVWAAHAEAPDVDPAEAERLRVEAAAAHRWAEELEQQAAELEKADDARARWYLHTAVTRDKAHCAGTELRARGIDPDDPTERITAEEWLAAHRAEQTDADRHREVRDEHELLDAGREPNPFAADAREIVESAVPDVRETSTPAAHERVDRPQRRRVATLDETAEAVRRAQDALAEIETRRAAEVARQAEDEQLLTTRRHEPAVEATDAVANEEAMTRQQ
ncbi:MAG: AAA family ATPase [Actinomycetia bacterium]|nr:AAA family ATPase [Actinomycetes bacterium]